MRKLLLVLTAMGLLLVAARAEPMPVNVKKRRFI